MNPATPVAIVLAAGQGLRVGSETPKQLLPLGGQPLVFHAIAQHLRLGHHVVVVVSAPTRTAIEALLAAEFAGASIEIVDGGATRRESVLAGIAAVPAATADDTAVILRNAASPNTPDDVVEACVDGIAAAGHDGMQAFVASEETTLTRAGDRLDQLLPRATTGFTRDPTVYRRGLLDEIGRALTDRRVGETTLDVARRLDARIGLVESPPSNIKVTTADDLATVAAAMGFG